MSVADGTYYIVNRVMDPDGNKLAMQSNGVNAAPGVTPLTNDPSQQWVLKTYQDDQKYVSPQGSPDLQVGWGDNTATLLPAGSYVWNFLNDSTGIKIMNGKQTVVWGVTAALPTFPIAIGPDNPREAQRWILIKA